MTPVRARALKPALRFAAFAALAVAAGCDGHHQRHYAYGDCTPSGCFGCTDNSQQSCWPLPHDPCSSDRDCQPGAQCTTIGCCSACHSDADCRQGEVCTSMGYCAPGASQSAPVGDGGTGTTRDPGVVACGGDPDCRPGETCVSGACTHSASCGIPRTLCATSGDCGSGRNCVAGLCRAACVETASCPTGQLCSSGTCMEWPTHGTACLLDADCGMPARCINAICHPLCSGAGQCGSGEFCDVGVCRADYRPAG